MMKRSFLGRGTAVAAILVLFGASAAWAGDMSAPSPEGDVLPVPVMTIYPGDPIDDAMLADEIFPMGTAESSPFAPSRRALVGKVARRTLLPGKPIPLAGVADPELVRRGVPIEVSFASGGLQISTVATALQSGSLGARIQLRNPESGRIITGSVQADGSVRVNEP